jgi:CRISPR/Cas system-associated exonuclease Cas4 (RecB family)
MLSRSSYPSVWERPGYPTQVSLPALVGTVIHGGLETILRRLHESGCGSVNDADAVQVLRGLGGYSSVVEQRIAIELESLEENPRVAHRLDVLRARLSERVPEMRRRVQAAIARVTLVPHQAAPKGVSEDGAVGPLREGSHPELRLSAPDLRFVGRADLLTISNGECAIVDFKTGAPHEAHMAQLITYALLWSRDTALNPAGIPVSSLVVAYDSHDVHVDPPSAAGLDEFAADLTARLASAESDLLERPPPARPSPATCAYCPVRQLCNDYWAAFGDALFEHAPPVEQFVDCEGKVLARNGSRSWVLAIGSPYQKVLLRTPSESVVFETPVSVRLTNVALSWRDDEISERVLTLTQSSEVFILSDD